MSSAVTSIFSRQSPAATPGPLSRLVRQQTIDVLHAQLKSMFDTADDTLFDWARRATGDEQHRCMSLMRVLRVRKPDVVADFFKSLNEKFDSPQARPQKPVSASMDELSIQSTEDLEESIAITNMTARAEGLFRDQLFELSRRLTWADENHLGHIDATPLEPRAISEAFLAASKTIDMEIETRLVVLKLFERTVMIQLGELYNRLLRTLEDNGIKAAAAQRAEQPESPTADDPAAPTPSPQISSMLGALGALSTPSPSAGFAPQQSGGAGYAGAGQAAAGGDYRGMAGAPAGAATPGQPGGHYAAGQAGASHGQPRAPFAGFGMPLPAGYDNYPGYTDARLAHELSERLSSWLQKPQANAQQQPIAQRAELIGRMFDGFKNDPTLPDSVKPVLETLRFPVLKAALADPGFLTNGQHPLRVLLNDLAATASSARTASHDPTADLSALTEAIAPLLTPDAQAVRANIDSPSPVSDEAVQSFLGQMDEDAALRRKTIVQRGMQRVDEELHRVLEARELLATAELLIDRALRPFLGLTLLRHSAVSPLWTQSLNLAERVIRSVELSRATEFSNADRTSVRDDLEDALVLERLPRERNQEAISSLRALHNEIEAYLEKKAPAPQAATPHAPAPPKPLLDYLTLGAWFRVYSRRSGETHWMRLQEHEPKAAFLVFGGFDAANRLTILHKDFEEDLISRRSEPLDPPPAFEAALIAARNAVNSVAADAIKAAQSRSEPERG